MEETDKVCIVGAGVSGLSTIKACLECGLTPVCYEKASDIGGLWNTKERKRTGFIPQLYDTLVANISKEGSCFSDFPAPKEWPPYLKQEQTLEYLRRYAQHFNLLQHVVFDTEIVSVRQSQTYEQSGSWIVRTKSTKDNEEKQVEFRAVVVASGQLNEQIAPDIPGLKDKFKGEVRSSGDFNASDEHKGKSILIIGASHSGCDIAVASSHYTENVYLSARHGAWIMPRLVNNGLPLDIAMITRFNSALKRLAPAWIVRRMLMRIAASRFDYSASGLLSCYTVDSIRATLALNDNLPAKLYSGQVRAVPGVKCLDERTVTFVDGTTVDVDVVVIATGYTSKFPFLSKQVIAEKPVDRKMHWWIFPFEMKHPSTLSFVGLIPIGNGPINSTAELQARYVADVLSGKRTLPSRKTMQKICERQRNATRKLCGGEYLYKATILEYREGLGSYLGLLPSFWKLLFTDPRLAFNVYFGPALPYHFRLVGENKWDGAREHSLHAIENAMGGMRLSAASNKPITDQQT